MSLSEYIKDLKDNEKEQVYTMFLGFESTSKEILVDIIFSSRDKNTIVKAMEHKNFSSWCWSKILFEYDFDNNITFEEVINKAYKKLEVMQDEKEWGKMCMYIVGSPLTPFKILEDILNLIMNKYTKILSKADDKDVEEIVYRWEFFHSYYRDNILVLIAVHPNSNIDLSTKLFKFLAEIVRHKEKVQNWNGYKPQSIYAFEKFLNGKNGDFLDCDYGVIDLSKLNNLPCMANGVILDFLGQCQSFKDENIYNKLKDSFGEKIFLDFVFDDKTTDEMIKKVLLDRLNNFWVSKEGTNEQELDPRIVSLLLSIVSDKRFEEKNISLALLKKIVLSCNNNEVIMKCLQKDDTGELISLVLSNGVKISVNDISKLSKGAIINIASTTNDSVFFYQILTFSPYAKDCIEIIWNRRSEFNDKEDKDKFYAGMLLCPFSTKEMLLESLNNYSKGNGAYTSRASRIILNDNMDYDVYKTLILKLEQNQVDLTLYDYERDKIEVDDFSSKHQISDDDYDEVVYKCEMIFKYVEAVATGSINEDTVVKFIAHRFGEKYLRAYYKLLDFKQQSQTLEQKQQHPHK